jgi:hypothetical protein
MRDASNRLNGRRELVDLCKSTINGQADFLVAVRRICALRFIVEDPENSVFMPIRAMESETDTIPTGLARKSFEAKHLEKIDYEMESYWLEMRPILIQACEEIVKIFSLPSRGEQ